MAKKPRAESTELLLLPVRDLIPTPDNTRVIDETSEDFRDLVDSITAEGVQIPVHVRPHPTKKGKWDLRAGAQRHRAAIKAGIDKIPAIVHRGMTDEEGLLLTYQENFNRSDLRPLEEGEIVASLLTKLGGDVQAVAARLGRKYTWVAQRAEIFRGLSPEWKKAACASKSPVASWSARALALIARLPENVQEYLLKELSQRHNLDDVRLVDLDRMVTRMIRPLGAQAWNAADESLVPKAGACANCIKRSSVEPGLWDEPLPAKNKGADRCLDAGCWQAKAVAQARRDIAAIKAEHGSVLLLSDGGADYYEQQDARKTFGNFLAHWQYKVVAKGAKGATPAVFVCGDAFGDKCWVIPQRERSAGPKQAAAPKSLAERRAGLDSKRWCEVLVRLAETLRSATVDNILAPDRAALVMTLAAAFSTRKDYMRPGDWSAVDDVLSDKSRLPAALAALWEKVRPVLADRLAYPGPITRLPAGLREEALRAAAVVGVDLDASYKTVSGEKGFTEPRSWAALEAEEKAAKKPSSRGGKPPRPASPFKKAAANAKRLREKAKARRKGKK
ncbi:MAG TPA: ParB/RepB/Spo0J family partition protein [Sumerlaeia bacterium]|nr:ParB/RepB/Spo0J family partition protein [Sumerlaeia bacterium]